MIGRVKLSSAYTGNISDKEKKGDEVNPSKMKIVVIKIDH